MPSYCRWIVLVALSSGCGEGEVGGRSSPLDDEPLSYTERTGTNPFAAPNRQEQPAWSPSTPSWATEAPAPPTQPAPPQPAPPTQERSCELAVDQCEGCPTYETCCACLGGDVQACDVLC